MMKLLQTVCLFLLLFFFAGNCYAADKPITVVYMDYYAPLAYLDENNIMTGVCPDFIEEAIHKRVGVRVIHKGYPWKRAQAMVEEGTADAMITLGTPARAKYGVFGKEPVTPRSYHIFVKKDKKQLVKQMKSIQKLEDLKPFTRIDFRGNGWTKENMEGKGYKIFFTKTIDMLWLMLDGERGDYVLANPYDVIRPIKKYGFTDAFEIISAPQIKELNFHYVLIVSKKSSFQWILPKFDEAIRAMKKDGTFQGILDKWYLSL